MKKIVIQSFSILQRLSDHKLKASSCRDLWEPHPLPLDNKCYQFSWLMKAIYALYDSSRAYPSASGLSEVKNRQCLMWLRMFPQTRS